MRYPLSLFLVPLFLGTNKMSVRASHSTSVSQNEELGKRRLGPKTPKAAKKCHKSSKKSPNVFADCAEQLKVQGVVGMAGGEIFLENAALVEFPQGAFISDAQVAVEIRNSPEETKAIFLDTVSIFSPSNTSETELTVVLSDMFAVPPVPTMVAFVPIEFAASIPDGSDVQLFALITQTSNDGDEAITSFVPMASTTFEAGLGLAVGFPLNPAMFTLIEDTGEYQAVIKLTVTAGTGLAPSPLGFTDTGRALQGGPSCLAASIRCPVSSGCTIVSSFRPLARNEPTAHYGIDLQVSSGESIRAPADGIIEQAVVNDPLYRTFLILRHEDGSATRLARLGAISVSVGQNVERGDAIATATTETDVVPVVHLEYAINGAFYASRGLIDPEPCIGDAGSVQVGDNGSLADDSFTLIIDGVTIGTTAIGARVETLGVSNLADGEHELTLVVAVAPDDIGTYFVELTDGWEFADGTTSQTGSPPEGTRVSWTFIVPDGFSGGEIEGNWWVDSSAGRDCAEWRAEEATLGAGFLNALPDCPCVQQYVCVSGSCTPSPNGWEQLGPASQTYHPGANHCMRSATTAIITTSAPGQQCCYDASNNLITGGYSAGTPDRFAAGFQISGFRHWRNDVVPFGYCPCTDYLELRPPNQGSNCPENIIFAC